LRKVKWGVLGVANIAVEKVIPAMQRGEASEIAAIASRDLARAREAAERLGIASRPGVLAPTRMTWPGSRSILPRAPATMSWASQ
jgi:predicted dehydrogenase